jgi:pimeloyl-ACP methyl ester carboxylesterase
LPRWRRRSKASRPQRLDLATPILFVPGVLGTTLVEQALPRRRIWGSAAGLIASRRLSVTADGTPGLEPGDVLWRFAVVPRVYSVAVYETLASRLEQTGYRRASLAAPTLRNGLYGLAYDWRHDIVTAARAIESAIARLTSELGIARIHVVAHSWGCNAVRYFLRYGGADVLASAPEAPRPGARNVAIFFALGPLYGGTLRALHEAQHGFTVAPGLGVESRQASTTASLYQLLPYDSRCALRDDGTSTDVDFADVDMWKSCAWGAFQPRTLARLDPVALEIRVREYISRGRRLWTVLDTPAPLDREVQTIVYTVKDQPTMCRLLIGPNGEPLASTETVKRRAPRLLSLVTARGDGYVTFDQVRRHCVGNELVGIEGCTHRDLCKDDTVLSHVARLARVAA